MSAEERLAALRHLDFLSDQLYHYVFEDGSDGADHIEPIRRYLVGVSVPTEPGAPGDIRQHALDYLRSERDPALVPTEPGAPYATVVGWEPATGRAYPDDLNAGVPPEPGAPDRDAIIRAVAQTHGVDNPNTAPGSWWEHKAGPVLDILASQPVPAPEPSARLDVERLDKALDRHAAKHAHDLFHHLCGSDCADDIADRYALAATPQDPEETPDAG